MSRHFLKFIHLAAFVIVLAWPLFAHAKADVEFIIDASGSMEAALGAQTRMEIAKTAIQQALGLIPPQTPVALRVYGHRIPKENKEQSCLDSELVIPFAPLNSPLFAQRLAPLIPRGYTPIAHSLKLASQDFLDKESEHIIILVSDGEETCGGNPTLEAQNLLAQGFNVKVHVIGFAVEEAVRAQLQAIAGATGGMYADAQDANSLNQNLAYITHKALLVQKPELAVRGQEIRGGDDYHLSIPLQPEIEYRLDHHQQKGKYDFFYVDLKKGQRLTINLATTDKGVTIVNNQFQENQNPYAGFRLVDSQFQEIKTVQIIGKKSDTQSLALVMPVSGRLYILVGSNYQDMHKDSPFKIKIDNLFDANTEQDAGDAITQPLFIQQGSYPKNWLIQNADKSDFYQLSVNPHEQITIKVMPEDLESNLRLEAYDRNRIRLASESAPNAGAVVALPPLVTQEAGPLYIHVTGFGLSPIGSPYSLEISQQTLSPGSNTPPPPSASPPIEIKDMGRAMEALAKKLANTELPDTLEEVMAQTMKRPPLFSTWALVVIAFQGLIILGLLVLVLILWLKTRRGPSH